MRCQWVACGMMSRERPAMRFRGAIFFSRSDEAVIRVNNERGDLIEAHEHELNLTGEMSS